MKQVSATLIWNHHMCAIYYGTFSGIYLFQNAAVWTLIPVNSCIFFLLPDHRHVQSNLRVKHVHQMINVSDAKNYVNYVYSNPTYKPHFFSYMKLHFSFFFLSFFFFELSPNSRCPRDPRHPRIADIAVRVKNVPSFWCSLLSCKALPERLVVW